MHIDVLQPLDEICKIKLELSRNFHLPDISFIRTFERLDANSSIGRVSFHISRSTGILSKLSSSVLGCYLQLHPLSCPSPHLFRRLQSKINKRLRARLDHRTPLQPTTTSRDLEQTWRQFAQKKETGTTPEILTAPSPIPILSLFHENDDNDIGNSTTASTRYIPPLLRNVNLEGPSSLETPVSTCAYQRRNSKSREWPNVSRGKKPLSWASSPATEEARGSREGLIADGRGQGDFVPWFLIPLWLRVRSIKYNILYFETNITLDSKIMASNKSKVSDSWRENLTVNIYCLFFCVRGLRNSTFSCFSYFNQMRRSRDVIRGRGMTSRTSRYQGEVWRMLKRDCGVLCLKVI